MNKIILVGRLTRDPVYRQYNNDKGAFSVANFDLAVKRNTARSSDDGAYFFHIKAFNKLADTAANYLHQGMRILVEGELQTSAYPDKETGEKKTYYEICAQRLEFLDGNSGNETRQTNGDIPPASDGHRGFVDMPEEEMDEMPFQ